MIARRLNILNVVKRRTFSPDQSEGRSELIVDLYGGESPTCDTVMFPFSGPTANEQAQVEYARLSLYRDMKVPVDVVFGAHGTIIRSAQ